MRFEKQLRTRLTRKKSLKKVGLPPGTLVFTGERKLDKVSMSVIDFNESRIEEKILERVEDSYCYRDTPSVSWININGIHNVEVIESIGKHYGIHPLVLEDILNIDQRPKMEDYGPYLYLVLKMINFDEKLKEIKIEQVSIIITERCVISFQEMEGDIFDAIRDRLKNNKGRIRKMGADYLAYSLIDAVVDGYFVALENLGEKIEGLQEMLISDPTGHTLQEIQHLKREILFLRRSVWPLREMIGALERLESPIIHDELQIYLRDLYDHTIQVIDTVESLRDMLSGMLDIYLSGVSNRMNEVMKVLTIIATVFIPLTFLAGIYGMNFEHMPELGWTSAYPLLLIAMATIGIIMVIYFKHRRWI